MVEFLHNKNRHANDLVFLSLLVLTGIGLGLEKLINPGYVGEDLRIENVQAFLLLTATILFGVRLLMVESSYRILFTFLMVATGFLFLEEISYGQRIIGFETPEFLSGNVQEEANLHNLRGSEALFGFFGLLLFGVAGFCIYKQQHITVGHFVIVPFLSRQKWLFVMAITGILIVSIGYLGAVKLTEPSMPQLLLMHHTAETFETFIYVFLVYLAGSNSKNW